MNKQELLAAFDRVGAAAVAANERLDIAVYGGSALMLASNFRFSSEDVDIAEIGAEWPNWLQQAVKDVARDFAWDEDWLNSAVAGHLSENAGESDHVALGTFPRDDGPIGLAVFVPTAEYMLALKLKAIRVLDPSKGKQEAKDIRNLMADLGLEDPMDLIGVLGRYFPNTAADPAKQIFLLKHVIAKVEPDDAPSYLGRSV